MSHCYHVSLLQQHVAVFKGIILYVGHMPKVATHMYNYM